MPRVFRVAKHHTVESGVVLEGADDSETQGASVEVFDSCEVIGRTRDADRWAGGRHLVELELDCCRW